MNSLQEKESPTVHRWTATMLGMLSWQVKLFETQCQVGLKMMEAAVRIPGGPPAGADEFRRLEAEAFERAQTGHALPREIYDVPYRDRVDWTRFPDWARPIDPELFGESGHEG